MTWLLHEFYLEHVPVRFFFLPSQREIKIRFIIDEGRVAVIGQKENGCSFASPVTRGDRPC